MATEEITLATGQKILTLRELLRPGLRAVFVGLNPSPVSVGVGHYWQGQHGIRRWALLREFEITPPLSRGAEDDAAFHIGYGFCDLVRRPTLSSADLSDEELRLAPTNLVSRLSITGDHPVIVFTYATARKCAEDTVSQCGYSIGQMPGPYASTAKVQATMLQLQDLLSTDLVFNAETVSFAASRPTHSGSRS